jgi:hypothetical protein
MNIIDVLPHSHALYQIVVRGDLGRHRRAWFDDAELVVNTDGTTTVLLNAADQAALHGMLNRIRDLGLVLVAVRLVY